MRLAPGPLAGYLLVMLTIGLALVLTATLEPVAPEGPHVIRGAFGVELGSELGDMAAKGWTHTLDTSLIWDRDNDAFFEQVMVYVLPEQNKPLRIMATRFYRDDSSAAKLKECRSDMDALAANVKAKYPSIVELLDKSAFYGSKTDQLVENGETSVEYIEPARSVSSARRVEIECSSRPSINGETKPAQLNISYVISPDEIAEHRRWLKARKARNDLRRGRERGIKPDEL